MRTMPAEVTPVNFPERIFVLLFMFFALSAFAVSVASLTQAYFKIFERGRSFNDEMFFVRMYLNRFSAAKPLEQRVKAFLAHLFERRRILAKETNLMEKLPEVLKNEVQNMLISFHLTKLEMIKDLGKGAIQEICAASHLQDHMPGVVISTMGQAGWLLLLCSGCCTAPHPKKAPSVEDEESTLNPTSSEVSLRYTFFVFSHKPLSTLQRV
ncbi:unnamed protein product [Symbiodinium natans]|uniref:Uncharacterized protein n=1 Tax=Symbiodinium natans TaxID=878477 RepID=A0A812P8P4_9DINO|nr:unnamed protein product [Symbiodinium natans]